MQVAGCQDEVPIFFSYFLAGFQFSPIFFQEFPIFPIFLRVLLSAQKQYDCL